MRIYQNDISLPSQSSLLRFEPEPNSRPLNLVFRFASPLIIAIFLLSQGGCIHKKKQRYPRLKVDSNLKLQARVKQYYNLGWIAGSGGNLELAINQFREALRLDPDHVGATHDMGLALAKLGKTRQAIEYFQKTLVIDSTYEEAYFNLSTAYFRMKQSQLGHEYLERCLELNPDHPKSLLRKAGLAESQGELRQATRIYSHYVKTYPKDYKNRARLGSLFFQQGLDENAKIELIKAVKKVQTSFVFYQLGVIFHRQGKFNQAGRYYQEVLKKDPNHVDTLGSIAEIYERKGNLKKALIHYERASGLEPENDYLRSKVSKLRQQ